MYLLRKAHLGEVSVTVWPKVLKDHVRRQEHHRSSSSSSELVLADNLSTIGAVLSARSSSQSR